VAISGQRGFLPPVPAAFAARHPGRRLLHGLTGSVLMTAPLRVVQLSDCHVSARAGQSYRGLDPRLTLEAVLEAAAAWSPDLVVATGDLSEDASPESYRYLAGAISSLGVPVLALPGNHDHAREQQAWFSLSPVDDPLVHEAGGWRLVLLNSTVADEVPGRLSPRMLSGLEEALAARPGVPQLVALHHQPVLMGSAWIDRYPLLEPEGFWELLARYAGVRVVLWGHVHQAFSALRGGRRLLGGPSTVSNSLPGRDVFTHDPAGPACRWLKLGVNGEVSGGILRAGPRLNPAATAAIG
jgi:Icc protein